MTRARVLASLLTSILFLLSTPAVTHACSVCFGNPDHPQTQGVKNAIVFLLIVIGGVLVALATFFIYLLKKSRIAARAAAVDGGRLSAISASAKNNGQSYR